MPDALQLQLTGLVLLVAWLAISMSWRQRRKWQQHLSDQFSDWEFRRRWQPHALDTSHIAAQVQQIRRDPVAAIRNRQRHAGYRQLLMTSARKTVLHLSYFQLANSGAPGNTEGEAPKHAV